MPTVTSSGAVISYETHGAVDAPPVLFLNSIGSTRALWDRQRRAFEGAYRVIQYDARGHGPSAAPPGHYTIAQLAQDALAILDAERLATAHVCGLSLGGITALWLGVHAPERVRSSCWPTPARASARWSSGPRASRSFATGDGGGGRRRRCRCGSRRLSRARAADRAAVPRDGRGPPGRGLPGLLRGAARRRPAGVAERGAVPGARDCRRVRPVHRRPNCSTSSTSGCPARGSSRSTPRIISNVEQEAAFNAALSTFLAAHA